MEMTNTQFLLSVLIQTPIIMLCVYYSEKYIICSKKYKDKFNEIERLTQECNEKIVQVVKRERELFELKKDIDVNLKRNILTEKVFTFKQIPSYALMHYGRKSGYMYIDDYKADWFKEEIAKATNWEYKEFNKEAAVNFYLKHYINNGKFNV